LRIGRNGNVDEIAHLDLPSRMLSPNHRMPQRDSNAIARVPAVAPGER
jgi:hypothetical protein